MIIVGSREMNANGKVLYADILKLYVKSPEDRERFVRISVELVKGSSPVNEKAVYVNITDEDDPLFFYGITITHDDFLSLKTHQNLLIDFNKFPEQLIQLLKLCSSTSESPKYLLLLEDYSSESVLKSDQLYLKFIEKNDFKQLCHLALKVGDHSVDELKEYMASEIRNLKDSASKKGEKISLLEAEIAKLKFDLAAAHSTLEESNKKWAEEKSALEIAHVKELTAERERTANAKLLWQKEQEERKAKELKDICEKINKLELELTSTRAQYNGTRDQLSEAKELNHTLNEKISKISSELHGLQQDVPRLKKQNIVLDADYHEKRRQLDVVKAESMQLKEELKAKITEAGDYVREIQTLKEEQAELEKSVDSKDKECKLLMGRKEELEKDVEKANSIIRKIHSDFEDIQRELLIKDTLLAQRERLIYKKEREIKQYGGEYWSLVENIKQLESIRDDLSHQLQKASLQLIAQDKELTHSKNVIGWLNRKLSEAQGRSPVAPMAPVTASTPYRGYSGDPSIRAPATGQPITNPCWQTLRPKWWSDTPTSARFPSAPVTWSTPETAMPDAHVGAQPFHGPQPFQGANAHQDVQSLPGPQPFQGANAHQNVESLQGPQPFHGPHDAHQGTQPVQGASAHQGTQPVQGASAHQGAHAHQGEHIHQVEAVAQGGPQETEQKMTRQIEHQSVDAARPWKKSSGHAGFNRGYRRTRYVKPRNTPSSYFPEAM